MEIFRPKLWDTLKNYTAEQFGKDAISGVILGIIALPLAIAFAIASGVGPEKGLITAIIAGFLISALGGSRVQIGGPTGAFIVIVYGVVQQFGVSGLIAATFIAGIMLILMGVARLGSVIKFIPHSLIIGFTSGIAVIIFSSQIKDFLGLEMGEVPADFIEKWMAFISVFGTVNYIAVLIAAATIVIILFFPLISKKFPGSLVAIILSTLAVQFFGLPVETIGSRFGEISSAIPMPEMPVLNFSIIRELLPAAFAIAMLGAIESLLSAVVADGMIGGNHRSNTELIGQGIGNIGSALFGGIPATGAIARTATNVQNNGRTPVAGIVHAVVLLLILIFLGKWAALIPLASLAGVLVVISFNMSEYRNFISILKGPKGDTAVMLVTFLFTVLVDLTIAIPVGIILAAFSFIRKMVQSSEVRMNGSEIPDDEFESELLDGRITLPEGVSVFEISGPMFFGAAYKIKEAMRRIRSRPQVLIIRMRHVPVIDATGLVSFREFVEELQRKNIKVMLSELNAAQVWDELERARILFLVGKGNIYLSFEEAVQAAGQFLSKKEPQL